MKEPYILYEGKKHYKRLYCVCMLQKDFDKITKNKLGFDCRIDNGQKIVMGAPCGIDILDNNINRSILNYIKTRYGTEDVYIDNNGETLLETTKFDTIDFYFEAY